MSWLFVLLFVNVIVHNVVAVVQPQAAAQSHEKEDTNDDIGPQTYINIPKNKNMNSAEKKNEPVVPIEKQAENVKQVPEHKEEKKVDGRPKTKNETTSIRIPAPINKNTNKSGATYELGSDAFERAVLVMGVLAFFFIIFVGIKTFRRKSNKMPMIVKYGVRTKRNDVEMEPLPLNEDDDDETIFDLSSNRR